MKKLIVPTITALISSLMIIGAKADVMQNSLSEKLLRVHIIANSDSARDQQEKLLIRDHITEISDELLKNCSGINEAKQIISENLDLLSKEAKKISRYPVKSELCKMSFLTRHYDNFTLPAGEYDAIRIILGNGAGKNWWCVMFPPLCVNGTNSIDACENTNLTKKEYELISKGENIYRYEFKLLELLAKFKNVLV